MITPSTSMESSVVSVWEWEWWGGGDFLLVWEVEGENIVLLRI